MLHYSNCAGERKHNQDREADADAEVDLAALVVARRFGLELHVARLIVFHAGLGGAEDRPTAGRAA